VVVGSVNEDQVLRVDALPHAGETVLADSGATSSGGKGANQAVASARAGAPTRFVGALGTDARARRLVAQLRLHGVDTTHLEKVPGPSGAAVVLVDRQGENSIVVQSGANAHLSPANVRDALADVTSDDVVLLQCEIPTAAVAAAVDAAAKVGATTVLNWSPVIVLPHATLAQTTVLVVNRGEALALTDTEMRTGRDGAELAARLAQRFGVDVVVTLGADGAACCTRGHVTRVAATEATTVVDSTGAGDTFAGALSAALLQRIPLESAARLACTAAAAAVSSLGAQPVPLSPSRVAQL
jgi:ribokinase